MKINELEMKKINNIQLEIFKEFIKICNQLNLKYYIIHGTLLGALRYKGFFPMDDDIDVAMPRNDYNIFLEKGPNIISKNLFIQSCYSEKEYPLSFSKIRNSNTTFIQPILNNFNINKGIYIDIFPLDFYKKNNIVSLKNKIYSVRISSRFNSKKNNFKNNILRNISKILIPSWHKAVIKKEKIYTRYKNTGKLINQCGKSNEKNMPEEWFGNGKIMQFEGMNVIAPSNYKKYLTLIYGDYKNFNPAAKYMNNDGTVEVSADIVDTEKSYKYYKREEY